MTGGRIEEHRKLIDCVTPEGETARLIIFRTYIDARPQVWLTFGATVRSTAVLSPAQAVEVSEDLTTAASGPAERR